MKIAAIAVAAIATGTFYGGVRLLIATHRFATGEHYEPGSFSSFAYSIAGNEPDGYAIYAPSVLVLGLGLFFGKFAYNLWTAGHRTSKHRQSSRDGSAR